MNRRRNQRTYQQNREARREEEFSKLDAWEPKTQLGQEVKKGEITDIAQILDSGRKILEPEIVDKLIPDLDVDFILIGQSKGKFGGGRRRIFRQTQKKTREGNKPIFSVMAVVGNKNGYIGVGVGKAKETLPAREKAIRNAKMNLMRVVRGCGSWQCSCGESHSIAFETSGKEASVSIKLMPAPKGTGLVVDKEVKKVLELAGIKDIWSKTTGQTKIKINTIRALLRAFKNASKTYVQDKNKITIGAK